MKSKEHLMYSECREMVLVCHFLINTKVEPEILLQQMAFLTSSRVHIIVYKYIQIEPEVIKSWYMVLVFLLCVPGLMVYSASVMKKHLTAQLERTQ